MNELIELLKSDNEESYRKAIEITRTKGSAVLETLKEEYFKSSDKSFKIRVVKLAGSIEDPSVVDFLKEALDDVNFEVRRASALALKILTDEDYFENIYRSEIGQTFKRSFWCYLDFVEDDVKAKYRQRNEEISKSFAGFFKKLGQRWTYPDPVNTRYFSFRRKKKLSMAEDGRVLFKNFNYSLLKVLESGKTIIYLISSLIKVIETPGGEKEELEDILRCLKQSMGAQLREMEEGISGFMASFHFVRTEMNLAMIERKRQHLLAPSEELSGDEKNLLDKLLKGFIDFKAFETEEDIDPEIIAYMLVILQKRLIEFIGLCSKFQEMDGIDQDSYLIFKHLGVSGSQIFLYTLNLLSYWCKDE